MAEDDQMPKDLAEAKYWVTEAHKSRNNPRNKEAHIVLLQKLGSELYREWCADTEIPTLLN